MTSLQKITQKPWCQRKVSESQKSFMVFAYEKKNNKKPDNFQEGWALGRRKTEVYPPKLTFLTFSRQKLSAKKVKDFMWVDMNEFCHPRMGPRSQQRCVFFHDRLILALVSWWFLHTQSVTPLPAQKPWGVGPLAIYRQITTKSSNPVSRCSSFQIGPKCLNKMENKKETTSPIFLIFHISSVQIKNNS